MNRIAPDHPNASITPYLPVEMTPKPILPTPVPIQAMPVVLMVWDWRLGQYRLGTDPLSRLRLPECLAPHVQFDGCSASLVRPGHEVRLCRDVVLESDWRLLIG